MDEAQTTHFMQNSKSELSFLKKKEERKTQMSRPPLPFVFAKAAASVALAYLLEFTARLPTSGPNRKLPMKTRNWNLRCKGNVSTERQRSNEKPRNLATPYPPSPWKSLTTQIQEVNLLMEEQPPNLVWEPAGKRRAGPPRGPMWKKGG